MCNACGFSCCAHDGFRDCGCENCRNPECWPKCEICGQAIAPIFECECDREDDDDYDQDAIDGYDPIGFQTRGYA